jgi:hypothetical protein
MMKNFTQKFIGILALLFTMSFTVNSQAQNNINLPQGWSMFGYNCDEAQEVTPALHEIVDKIVIVKDHFGNAYLPELDFNGIGNFTNGVGYQVKMIEQVDGFQFCSSVLPDDGIGQADLDSVQTELAIALESLSDLTEQMGEIELSYNSEQIAYISEFVNSLLLDVNTLLDSDSLDLNSLTVLAENYLTPGIAYLTDNSLVTDEEVSLLYNILFDIAGLVANQEDGISQADVDAAFDEGAASVIPEDGIGQADVDAVQQQLTAANQTISELQAEGDWNYPPEDYSWYWGDVALCLEGDAFMCANAAQYLAEYNASDSDIPWEIEGCVNTISMGWDLSYAAQYSCPEALIHPLLLADFFGATYVDECGVPNGDNSSCSDECGVPNGDNSTCSDCAGVANGTSIDLGCGCGNPLPQSGYDCDGEVQTLQIGVLHAGGRVFQINEDGTGLVADLQDLGQINWYEALDVAASATSQGYDDWYLPNFEELKLMYNTIGQGADNAGGFEYDWYWSSTTYTNPGNPFLEGNGNYAWTVNFNDGNTFNFGKGDTRRVRVIRAF